MKARHRLSKVIVFGAVLTIVALWAFWTGKHSLAELEKKVRKPRVKMN